jgi:POT family proton-dependent oligopeptide transporter
MWSYGFAAAGVGMLIGTTIYMFALRVLPDDRPKKIYKNSARPPFSKSDWRAFIILWLLFIPGCMFWATYEQSGNTVEVWTSEHLYRGVNLGFTQFTLTIGAIQSVNGLFILLFTPLLIMFWKREEKAGREPDAVIKMSFGYLILGLSYLVLAGAQWAAGGAQVYWFWCILYTAVYTVGELYFSPIGLSLYSKAAPPQVAAFMMAVFLATSFPGNFIAGWLGTFYSLMSPTRFFLMIAIISAAPAPIFWAFNRPIRNILKHRAEQDTQLSVAQ